MGRLVEPQKGIYERVGDQMRWLGSQREVSGTELRERLEIHVPHEWRTTSEILDLVGNPKPSADLLTRVLTQMAGDELVIRKPSLDLGNVPGKKVQWRAITPLLARS